LPSEKEQTMVNTPFWTVLGLGYRASFSWFEILGLESFILLLMDTFTKS
jgi:hypothetical protein